VLYQRFSFYKKIKIKIVAGANGDLTVLNGQTVTLASGLYYDYNNVTVNAGGILEFTGSTGGITQLGVRNNLIVNGIIRSNGIYNGGTYNLTTIAGEVLNYTISQALGGNGGGGSNTGNGVSRAAGGAGTNGYGGGGGGGPSGGYFGGAGGSNNGSGSAGSLFAGGPGNITKAAGANADTSGKGANGGGSGGGGGGGSLGTGGGGGGYKGKHGVGLYIYCEGNLSGTGQIQTNGTNGFNGGKGDRNADIGGGGGGGGAGGSGANLWLRCPSSSVHAITMSVIGGSPGIGGASSGFALAGASGLQGSDGVYNLVNI
jgi:hypothetical protein